MEDGSEQRFSLEQGLELYGDVLLASRNFAPRTRGEYFSDLLDVVKFLIERCSIGLVIQVQRNHLEAYLAELDRRGFSGNSRRRKVASIRSFFGYLESTGAIAADPTRRLVPPAREYRQPRVLTEGEYKRLQLACAHETRDAALIELLLQTGMRLSELARLRVSDVELPAKIARDVGHVGSVHVLGKGRKERTITLNWKVCRAVRAYLAVRAEEETSRLFLTKFGEGIGPRAIQNVVRKYLNEAGIQGARVHTLRHTFATHQVKKGTKLDVVRQALGHESLQTTSIYIDLAREVMDKELQENAL